MEEAEHALWRAAGLSVSAPGMPLRWPRVAAAFDYRNPLSFEDEFVVTVHIETITRRTIRFAFSLERGDTSIGAGTLTAACATKDVDGTMRSMAIPADTLERLEKALGPSA